MTSRRVRPAPSRGAAGIRTTDARISARAEALAIADPESGPVAGLVVGPRAERGAVARIRLFQLALALEVPAAVAGAVLAAGGAAFGHPALVAGAVGGTLGGRRRRTGH